MKIIASIVLSFLLFGCVADSQEAVQTGNFVVEYLFEHEGCKMYRFRDGGMRYIYYSNCTGKTSTTYKSGKNSTTDIESHTTKTDNP